MLKGCDKLEFISINEYEMEHMQGLPFAQARRQNTNMASTPFTNSLGLH